MGILQLALGYFAEVLDKEDDCVLVEINATLEDVVYLGHLNVLNHKFGVGFHYRFSQGSLLR